MTAKAASERAKRRLAEIDGAYRRKLKELHDGFNRHYDETMRKHGLSIGSLMDHHSFPAEFHADIADERKALIAGRAAALQERSAGVSSMPRRRARA